MSRAQVTVAARGMAAAAIIGLAWFGVACPNASAAAPTVSGWWYEANVGLPIPTPAPPSVPAGGLYVENGFAGPAAIAALSIPVASGAAVGQLVLHIAGPAVISQPPIACPLQSPSFSPVEDGAWSSRPTYDCQRAQSTGTVGPGDSTVTFNVAALLDHGSIAVAILAGGAADQIAFDKPGPDTLAITPPAATPASSVTPAVPAPSAATAPGTVGVAGPSGELPGISTGLTTTGSGTASSDATSTAGGATSSGGSTGHGDLAAPLPAAVIHHHTKWRTRIARLLGVTALLIVLIAWTEGYGILGGRIASLAAPLADE